MHHGLRRSRSSRVIDSAWVWIGPDLGEAGHLRVDVEEAGDPPCRRRVEHDRVVGRGPGGGGCPWRADGLVDLAGEQHVAHARGDRGREVDDADRSSAPPARPSL